MTKIIATVLILLVFALSTKKMEHKLQGGIPAIFITIMSIGVYMFLEYVTPDTVNSFPYRLSMMVTVAIIQFVIIRVIISITDNTEDIGFWQNVLVLSPIIIALVISFVYVGKDFPRKEFFDNATSQIEEKEIELLEYNEDLQKIVMSPRYAKYLIGKAMNQVPNSEFFQINEVVIQEVDGKLSYVADLEYASYFKWKQTKTFPGYFILDATSENAKVKFVKKEYEYASSAYFEKNAERVIREKNPTAKFVGDPTIEIDAEGNVYYTMTFAKAINVTKGNELTGVYLLNAHTGEGEFFEKGKIPEWIDGGIAPEYAYHVAKNFAHWNQGRFNWSDKGRKALNDNGYYSNMKPILVNGQLHYMIEYSTFKNQGNNSMVGYILMNTNTGEFFLTEVKDQSLIDSSGAVSQGEKFYIEKQYDGRSPMLYSLDGELAWVILMHDGDGLLQNYYVVSANNANVSATEKTLEAAMSSFQKALKNKSSLEIDEKELEDRTKEITVDTIVYEQNGEYHYVYIKSTEGQMFVYTTEQADPILFTKEGDVLTLNYKDLGEGQINPINEIK